MHRLQLKQWESLSDLIVQVHSAQSEEQLMRVMLEDFPKIFDNGVFVCWNEHKKRLLLERLVSTASHHHSVLSYLDEINATVHTHPIADHFDLLNGGVPEFGVLSYRDCAEKSGQWDERAIFCEVYRHMDLKDQLVVSFSFDESYFCNLSINSEKRFSESHKYMVQKVLPHLVLAYRRLSVPSTARKVLVTLSPRHQETAKLLASGLARKEIADRLGVSLNTINEYCKKIFGTFGVHSQAELMNSLVPHTP